MFNKCLVGGFDYILCLSNMPQYIFVNCEAKIVPIVCQKHTSVIKILQLTAVSGDFKVSHKSYKTYFQAYPSCVHFYKGIYPHQKTVNFRKFLRLQNSTLPHPLLTLYISCLLRMLTDVVFKVSYSFLRVTKKLQGLKSYVQRFCSYYF